MALTRQDWESVKDKFIDTAEMLHKHLVGYDILKRMFTDEQMLQYTSNIKVETQYHYTCLATWVGENDYKLGVSRAEQVQDCDMYGRPIPNKLRDFIDQVDTGKLYLNNHENSVLYGDIKIDIFRNNFSEYENLLFHHGDNTGNYFGTYGVDTKRMCNRVNYYVNLTKLSEHLTR